MSIYDTLIGRSDHVPARADKAWRRVKRTVGAMVLLLVDGAMMGARGVMRAVQSLLLLLRLQLLAAAAVVLIACWRSRSRNSDSRSGRGPRRMYTALARGRIVVS